MSIIEKIGHVDLERLRLEIEAIPKGNQVALQGIEGQTDPYWGTKSAVEFPDGIREEDFTIPLFDLPYINFIMRNYSLSRTRLMRQQKKSCYSYHIDDMKRFHIPIYTNDKCFFIINDLLYRLPADGSIFLVDTTLIHTAVNASFDERIHLVGNV